MADNGHQADPTGQDLPRHVEAEMALIGIVLERPERYDSCLEIGPDDFSDPGLASLWDAIGWLIREQGAFHHRELAATIDGKLLARLVAGAPPPMALPNYVRLVKEFSVRRRLIEYSGDLAKAASGVALDLDVLAEAAETLSLIESLATHRPQGDWVTLGAAAQDALSRAETARETQGRSAGIPTGITAIDRVTGGVPRGEVTIIAARAGMGKTASAGSMALNMATAGVPVSLFSLEMQRHQLAHRLICVDADVDSDKARRGVWADQAERERFRNSAAAFDALPLLINDTSRMTVEQVALHVRAQHRRGRARAVFVDYLGYMQPSEITRRETRAYQLEHITRSLKDLAKTLDIPIVLLAQISRATEAREDKRPELSDLRGSGAIEMDAALVLMIYRAHYYLMRQEPDRAKFKSDQAYDGALADWRTQLQESYGKAEIIIAKNRHGPFGQHVTVAFDDKTSRFGDIARQAEFDQFDEREAVF